MGQDREGRDKPSGAPAQANAARHRALDLLLDTRLGPMLPELAAVQGRYRLGTLGALGLSGLLLALGIAGEDEALFLVGFMGLVLAAGALSFYARRFRDRLRALLMPLVCEAIGGIAHRVGDAAALVGPLRRLPLVASFSDQTIDDVFSGAHDDTRFTMAELRLFNRTTRTSGSGTGRTTTTRERTVFRGLAFMIATPAPMPARIVIRGPRRLAGLLGGGWRPAEQALRAAGFARADVPDAGFARHLALWADDPDQALRIIGPDLAATLARLAATAGRQRIDAGLAGVNFLLLLPRRGNAFAAGGLFVPLSRLRRRAHALLEEVMVVHRLIDVLKGRPVEAAPTAV